MAVIKFIFFIFMLTTLVPLSGRAQMFGSFMQSQNVCGAYQGLVKSFGFESNWKLNESSGNLARDAIGTNNGSYLFSPVFSLNSPLAGQAGSHIFNGIDQQVETTNFILNPTTITLLIWFKTTQGGGKLLGFGTSSAAASSAYDRHIYMTDAGQIVFGVYNFGTNTIMSSSSFNDGNWHMATATLGPAGMELFVDGKSVGRNGNTVTSPFDGYWRIGFDQIAGWPSAPTSHFFAGQLAEAAVSSNLNISLAQIHSLYNLGKNCQFNIPLPPVTPVIITSADYGFMASTCDATSYAFTTCSGLPSCSLYSSNGICGDPASGQVKTLNVNYTCAGVPYTASAGENTSLTFACP